MSKAGVRVDDFSPSDYRAVKALWEESGLEFTPGDEPAEIRRKLERDPELFLVAREGPRVVGSVMGAWDGRRGWIYHLAVSPSHRRAGVASTLLKEVESRMRRKGVVKVKATVYSWNAPSFSLFEKNGYSKKADQVVVSKDLRDPEPG